MYLVVLAFSLLLLNVIMAVALGVFSLGCSSMDVFSESVAQVSWCERLAK